MQGLLIAAYLLLITPLRVGAAIQAGGGLPRAMLGVMIWGVPIRIRLSSVRDEKGVLRLETKIREKKRAKASELQGPAQGVMRIIRTLKKANIARMLLKRGMRISALTVLLTIGGQDAALTALLTAALRALGAIVPTLVTRVRPGFGEKPDLRAHCIVESRLGTLMLTCLLGLISYARAKKKEDKPWIIPSET